MNPSAATPPSGDRFPTIEGWQDRLRTHFESDAALTAETRAP